MYLNLTGQSVHKCVPREGRRWMIEDYDIISTLHYYQEGILSVGEWFKSLKGLEEGAWFNRKDLLPFFWMFNQILKKLGVFILKRLRLVKQ